MDQGSIDDPRSRWMIQMRLMRRDLEDPNLGEAEHDRLEEQLEQLIGVPMELRHRDRVKELTEDQLIRLSRRHEPEEDLDPLPEFVTWQKDRGHPDDGAFVMVLWRVEWSADGPGERVGSVQVHTSDSRSDGAIERGEMPWYSALSVAVEQAWTRGLDRVYLTKLPAKRR